MRNHHPEAQDQSRPHPPPQFIKPLPETTDNLKEGQTVHLECQLEPTSDNTMQIVWMR